MSETVAVLTERQIAIIRGLASGLTQDQLCTRLNRADATLTRDLVRARRQLGAETTAQLIDRAWRLGILDGQTPPMRHEQRLPDAVTVRPLRKHTRKAAGR